MSFEAAGGADEGAVRFDAHAHCFRPDLLPYEVQQTRARAHIARRRGVGYLTPDLAVDAEQLAERMVQNMADPDGSLLRSDLTAAGLERALIVGLDWGLVGEESEATAPEAQLEWAAELVEAHQGFFSFVYCVDPRRPRAGTLASRALAKDWVAGIKLYPPAGFSPTADECSVMYEAALDAGAFVMAHTGRTTHPMLLEHSMLEPYAAVQRRYPDLRLVLAHAGQPFWGEEAIAVASGHATTTIEVSGWQRELESNHASVERFLTKAWAELGSGRVLFGTDHMSGARLSTPETVTRLRTWRRFFEKTAATCGVRAADSDAAIGALVARV